MSFRDFMDASYALLAEEHTRVTPFASLLDVAERIAPKPKATPARRQETKAANEESMNILTAAMSGTRGKGPLMGKKRPRV